VSTLLVSELITELEHEVRFSQTGRIHIAGLYPYLLKFGSPAGTFTISFIKGATTLFSKSFAATSISATAYAHTFYPVLPDNPVQIEAGLYTIKLTATGYSFNSSAYIAWIQQFENIQNAMEYTPENDTKNPLAIRIKTYKEGIE